MKRILVVDDDRMECVMTKYALGEEYDVFTVNSGREALEFLEENTVDLILMDIMMPEMNGKETARKIREQEKWTGIPIVFLTADETPKTEVECLSNGADDFITKPFVPLVMNTRIKRVLEVYDLRKELEQRAERQTERFAVTTLTDSLTGLHTREYMEQNLRQLLNNGGSGTLFMIDLDNFKKMNDTYGHIIGDKTLQYFADVLRKYAREGDMLCRLSGDEFLTFYPELAERETAAKKAEGIISEFKTVMSEYGYEGIVTASIGIVVVQKGGEFQNVYSRADKSLYFIKNNGKGAYHFYDDREETVGEISTDVDLEYVSCMIENGLSEQRGAFHLAFDEFKNVYDFVSRCVARKKQKVQVVLFTMSARDRQLRVSMEEIMQKWENALVESLRVVDTGTRYSNSQYMAILMDADEENGKKVAERVIENFYNANSKWKKEVMVTYDLRTLQPAE